jgi:rRNA maturation RNase YbeY
MNFHKTASAQHWLFCVRLPCIMPLSMNTCTIVSTIKTYPHTLPFDKIKQTILGVRYELSLLFVGEKRAASLNRAYRQKTYTPNVLSFPLNKTTGEIFICPSVAKREAKKYDLTAEGYVAYLFIHGCLHLKGYDHGDTMDKLERKYLTMFNIT